MFSRESDASKIAAAVLYDHLEKSGYALVDSRDLTPVLEKMGYRKVPRAQYEALLREHASAIMPLGPWAVGQPAEKPAA
jgi:leucyl/phenylalanyl-tRNA--protein transferase